MPRVNVGDIGLHYEEAGTGEALLLLGGTAVGCAYWRKFQLPVFSERYRTITVDLRGAGQSDQPVQQYSTELFASDLFGLLDALGIEQSNVLGHSMGASVAQMMAVTKPDRIKRLVLASSGGHFDPAYRGTRGISIKLALDLVDKGYLPRMREHYAGRFTWPPEFAAQRPDLVREMADTVSAALPPLPCYLRHVIARQEHDLGDRIAGVRCPALILVGSEETIMEGTMPHLEAARHLARVLPKSVLVELAGAAHGYFWQIPEEVNRIVLEFLTTPVGGTAWQ